MVGYIAEKLDTSLLSENIQAELRVGRTRADVQFYVKMKFYASGLTATVNFDVTLINPLTGKTYEKKCIDVCQSRHTSYTEGSYRHEEPRRYSGMDLIDRGLTLPYASIASDIMVDNRVIVLLKAQIAAPDYVHVTENFRIPSSNITERSMRFIERDIILSKTSLMTAGSHPVLVPVARTALAAESDILMTKFWNMSSESHNGNVVVSTNATKEVLDIVLNMVYTSSKSVPDHLVEQVFLISKELGLARPMAIAEEVYSKKVSSNQKSIKFLVN